MTLSRGVGIICVALGTVVCIGLSAFSSHDTAMQQLDNRSAIESAFIGALETQTKVGTFTSPNGLPSGLTVEERRDALSSFESMVEQYYSVDNPLRDKYIILNEQYLDVNLTDVIYTVSSGLLDYTFNSIHINDNDLTAEVDATYVGWDKRIQGDEEGFEIAVPVNRDHVTATMIYEDNDWKLLSINSHTKEYASEAIDKINSANTPMAIGENILEANISSAENICNQVYASFDEALKAAESINVEAINPFDILSEIEQMQTEQQ